MPPLRNRLFFLVLLFVQGSQTGWGQEEIFRQKYNSAGDTFVLVESIFGKSARHGALPYRITIRNNTGRDRVWDIALREGNPGRHLTTASTYSIAVESGTEVRRDITFQFAPAFLAYDYRNLNISVSSSGLPPLSRNEGEQTNQAFPAIIMSEPLARRSLARLDDLVRKENSANVSFAKSVEVSYLPADWKGYSGIDAFLIDLNSWQALSLAQRQAIFSWVRLGGRLDIYSETDIPLANLKLPVRINDPSAVAFSVSLGEVRLQRWDGRELPDTLISRYRTLPSRAETFDLEFNTGWNLQKAFGTKPFNPTLVFILLLAFAIVVAPVNLFYLAKPGRRHRLFITTPVISVVTCLLVIVLILFIDGIGGRGIRTVLADLQPSRDEMRLYLSQEQISRTGVMVNTGFETDMDYDISPVRLPESNFNPFSPGSSRDTVFEITGGSHVGGFFRSRSEQAFSIRSVETTRSRIELAPPVGEGSPPALTSNLPQPVTDLIYIDEEGNLWSTPEKTRVPPGGTIPLKQQGPAKWPEWLRDSTLQFSNSQQEKIESLRSDRNRFFARLENGEALALPTHRRIVWESTSLILTGTPVIQTASSAPSEANPAPPAPDDHE